MSCTWSREQIHLPVRLSVRCVETAGDVGGIGQLSCDDETRRRSFDMTLLIAALQAGWVGECVWPTE